MQFQLSICSLESMVLIQYKYILANHIVDITQLWDRFISTTGIPTQVRYLYIAMLLFIHS